MSKPKSRMSIPEDIRPDRAYCQVGEQRRLVVVQTEVNELLEQLCWKRTGRLTQELLGLLKGSIKTRELITDVVITVRIDVEYLTGQ